MRGREAAVKSPIFRFQSLKSHKLTLWFSWTENEAEQVTSLQSVWVLKVITLYSLW